MTSAADRAVFGVWRIAAALRRPRLHWKYLRRMKCISDVARPVLFSERMLWRKLFDRNPDFVTFSDKLACKRWIAERLPELPIPRVLWQGDRAEDILPDLIRTGVAIRANHGSGFNLLIRGTPPPHADVVETARRWLATDWGRRRGEWSYARVPRRVFVEDLVVPPPGETLYDVKMHAGGGEIGFCNVFTGTKAPAQRSGRYAPDGTPLGEAVPGSAALPADMPLPPGFHRAVAFGRRLGLGMDYARLDVLVHGEQAFASEITVFTAAGYRDFSPALAARIEPLWDLRRSWFLSEGAWRGGRLMRAYAAALSRALSR